MKNTQSTVFYGFLGAVIFAASNPSFAMEAPSVYPMGIANFGVAAMPPPGVYVVESVGHIDLQSVRNNAGDKISAVRNFSTKLDIISTRVNWMTGENVLGGRLLFAAVLPVARIEGSRTIGPMTIAGKKSGTLDLSFNAAVGYDIAQNVKAAVGLSVYAPTGSYNVADSVNLGKNHWAIEPMGAISYINKSGLNADITGGLIFNGKNKDTGYKSGVELHFDYAAGWGFGNGLTAGAGGFYWQQLTDDKNKAGEVHDYRAMTFAIGPVMKYDSGKGWNASAQYSKMVKVKNGPRGDIVWLKMGFKF